jgi:hypothetical protein
MKTANATWYVDFTVECPYCEKDNDLLLVDEWYICLSNVGESKSDVNYKHECDHCKQEFLIEDIEH